MDLRYFQIFIMIAVFIIAIKSLVIIPYIKATLVECSILKKFIDVALINCIMSFFVYYIPVFISAWPNTRDIFFVAMIAYEILLTIIFSFIESRYYYFLWNVQFEKCFIISILANIAYFISIGFYLFFILQRL